MCSGAPPPVPELPPGEEFTAREELKLAELLAAVKATGQIGSFRYGLLAATEDDTEYYHNDDLYLQGGRDFGALRVLYEDSRGAAYRGLGFISTLVRHPDSDAIVHGIDFHRLSSEGSWDINGQVLYSDVTDEGTGYGAFTDIDYVPGQGLLHSFNFTYYDDKIDINDLGFLRRNDTREARYNFNWIQSGLTWRPRHKVTLNAEAHYHDSNGWLLHQEDEHFTSFVTAQWQPEISFDYFFYSQTTFQTGVSMGWYTCRGR
jgi:hypothetical protein